MAVIEGRKELASKLKKIEKTAKTEIERALVTGGLMVERDYKLNVNRAGLIDTGRWINSITHKKIILALIIPPYKSVQQ